MFLHWRLEVCVLCIMPMFSDYIKSECIPRIPLWKATDHLLANKWLLRDTFEGAIIEGITLTWLFERQTVLACRAELVTRMWRRRDRQCADLSEGRMDSRLGLIIFKGVGPWNNAPLILLPATGSSGGHIFECHIMSSLTLTDSLRRSPGVKHFVQLHLA